MPFAKENVNVRSRQEQHDPIKTVTNGVVTELSAVSDFQSGHHGASPTFDEQTGTFPETGSSPMGRKWTCLGFFFSWRVGIALLLHASFVVSVVVRNCLFIGLVCMSSTQKSTVKDDHKMNGSISDAIHDNETMSEPEFAWTSEFQGIVLSASAFLSFLGPLVTNALQPHLGHKSTLTFLTLASVALTLVTPVATRFDPWLLVACRVIIGTTYGCNVPIIGDFVAWWAPTDEKQTLISIAFSGLQTGGILTSLLSGYLCTIPVDNGWPFVFYVNGGICLVFVVFWHFLSSSKPENHKYISQEELHYIQQHRLLGKGQEGENKRDKEAPPFKTIMTSVPVVVFLFCSALHYWTINLFFTYQAVFLAATLDFAPSETGVLISLFSTTRFMGVGAWTMVANKLTSTTQLSSTAVKKICICLGMLVSSGVQISVIFMDVSQRWMIVAVFFVTMVTLAPASCLLPGLPQELAPRYAGFITGLFFSISNVFSITAPLMVAALTPNNTMGEWNKVWIIMTSIFLATFLAFLIFGDARLQPWAVDTSVNALEVVPPFDPMQKGFSSVLHPQPLGQAKSYHLQQPLTIDVSPPIEDDGRSAGSLEILTSSTVLHVTRL